MKKKTNHELAIHMFCRNKPFAKWTEQDCNTFKGMLRAKGLQKYSSYRIINGIQESIFFDLVKNTVEIDPNVRNVTEEKVRELSKAMQVDRPVGVINENDLAKRM